MSRDPAPVIGLLGDVMLGRSVGEAVRVRPAWVWSAELRAVVAGCDLVVCNLECCISDRGEQTRAIPGKPFFFRGPPAAVESLAALGVRAVSLANNHALDFGQTALEDTLTLLHEAGIATAGAGRGPEAARRGAVIDAAGTRVGLLALTDHPAQYAARDGELGVAQDRLDSALPEWARDELGRLGREADLVVAYPHWGPNMSPAPAGWQRRRAADLLGAGADLVAGHSAHVFHGIERHGRGFAAYDLGGALDDYAVHPGLRNDLGLLALWRPGGRPELELVGLRLEFCHTTTAGGADADWIATRLTAASRELGSEVKRVGEDRFVVR